MTCVLLMFVINYESIHVLLKYKFGVRSREETTQGPYPFVMRKPIQEEEGQSVFQVTLSAFVIW